MIEFNLQKDNIPIYRFSGSYLFTPNVNMTSTITTTNNNIISTITFPSTITTINSTSLPSATISTINNQYIVYNTIINSKNFLINSFYKDNHSINLKFKSSKFEFIYLNKSLKIKNQYMTEMDGNKLVII